MASITVSGGAGSIVALPDSNLGSDEILKELPRKAGVIEHQRHGLTVSSRVWKTQKRWRFKFNSISASYAAVLRSFFEIKTFWLLPYDITAIYHVVRWVGDDFQPEYIAPDQYSIEFVLEEVIS